MKKELINLALWLISVPLIRLVVAVMVEAIYTLTTTFTPMTRFEIGACLIYLIVGAPILIMLWLGCGQEK